jgi:hypothetical protein
MRFCLALTFALSACSYFPSHEEVFVPVPLTVGEARVVDGDTSWVLAEPGYEVVAARRELLPEARRALDGAAEQFRGIFGVAPLRVTVALHEPRGRDDEPTTLLAGEAGGEVVPVPLPPEGQTARQRARPRPIPLAPVARAWLLAYADARAGTPRLRTAYAPGVPADDPRLPDWLEEGVVGIVAGHPARDILLAQLARDRARALPLRQLLAMSRPTGREPMLGDDPVAARPEERRALVGGELEGARLFSVQSYGVARFVVEREGRPMLGAMVDRVIAGEPALAALGAAKHLTSDVEMLQREWDRWLEEEAESGPRR